MVATHQKTQQGLKLSALPAGNPAANSRNASENPAGIETRSCRNFEKSNKVATHQKTQQGLKPQWILNMMWRLERRNASENPAGIETQQMYLI